MGLPSLADISSGLGDLAMGFVNNANPVLRSGLGAYGDAWGIDTLGWAHDRAIQQAGDDRRSDLYAERDREAIGFGWKYELPSVQMENFEAMAHEQMKAAVDSTKPGSMLEDAHAWRNAAEEINASVTAFNGAIRGVIEGGWEGRGADSARANVATYAQQSLQLEHAARLVANKIEEAHTGIDQARQRMPEPDRGGVLDVLRGAATLDPVGGLIAAFHKSEAVRQQAIQVMTTEYAPVVLQADSRVPILPLPHAPSGPGAEAAPNSMTGAGATPVPTGLGGIGSLSSNAGAGPQAGTPGAGDPTRLGSLANANDAAAEPDQAVETPTNQTDPASTAATTPADTLATTPAGQQSEPTAANRPSVLPGGTTPSSVGGVGGAGPVLPGGIASAGLPGTTSLVSPISNGNSSTPASSTTLPTTGAGRAAVPGMGGGFLPPAARQGNEESEHDTPEYLLNVANGNELIGHLPKVAPPVLGG